MSTSAVLSFCPMLSHEFDYFYHVRKAAMLPHVLRLGRSWNESEELFYNRKRFALGHLRKIYLGDVPIGFIGVRPDCDNVVIESFCIEPSFQNQGLGTRILQIILSEKDTQGRTVTLDLMLQNPAARLYERFGFKKIGEDHKALYYKRSAKGPGGGV